MIPHIIKQAGLEEQYNRKFAEPFKEVFKTDCPDGLVCQASFMMGRLSIDINAFQSWVEDTTEYIGWKNGRPQNLIRFMLDKFGDESVDFVEDLIVGFQLEKMK